MWDYRCGSHLRKMKSAIDLGWMNTQFAIVQKIGVFLAQDSLSYYRLVQIHIQGLLQVKVVTLSYHVSILTSFMQHDITIFITQIMFTAEYLSVKQNKRKKVPLMILALRCHSPHLKKIFSYLFLHIYTSIFKRNLT